MRVMTNYFLKTFFMGISVYFISSIFIEVFIPDYSYKSLVSFLFLVLFLGAYLFYNKKVVSKEKQKEAQNQADERFYQVRNAASWNVLLILFISRAISLLLFGNLLEEASLQIIRIILLYLVFMYFLVYFIVEKRM